MPPSDESWNYIRDLAHCSGTGHELKGSQSGTWVSEEFNLWWRLWMRFGGVHMGSSWTTTRAGKPWASYLLICVDFSSKLRTDIQKIRNLGFWYKISQSSYWSLMAGFTLGYEIFKRIWACTWGLGSTCILSVSSILRQSFTWPCREPTALNESILWHVQSLASFLSGHWTLSTLILSTHATYSISDWQRVDGQHKASWQ